MKETLQVDGRELSLEEGEAIVREHFSPRPTEGVPFEVNPQHISESLFQEERKEERQESTRQLILEALDEVKKNPDRYGNTFWTLQPEKTWEWKTTGGLVELAEEKGGHIANWVEQALEWAQRITNGETWKAICNKPDTANWYRLVQWKDGNYRNVGGSLIYDVNYPASDVGGDVWDKGWLYHTVPLVVLY